jgi:hypothetical protein
MTRRGLASRDSAGKMASMSAPLSAPVVRALPVEAVKDETLPQDPIVVHVRCAPDYAPCIRIWQSTFLLDQASSITSELLRFENISLYPHWYPIPEGRPHRFTLVFRQMPRSVRIFDLAEIIPEPRGWFFPGIRRNDEDVYWLDLPN